MYNIWTNYFILFFFILWYFETIGSCYSFFFFFFNYLETSVESWILWIKSLDYIFNLIVVRVKFCFLFFFFSNISKPIYTYIPNSKYFALIIFHIGTRLKYLKFRGLRARTEIWIISILYSAISLQIFSTKYSNIII